MSAMIDAVVVGEDFSAQSMGWLHLTQLTEIGSVKVNHIVGSLFQDKEQLPAISFHKTVDELPMLGANRPCLAFVLSGLSDIPHLFEVLAKKGATHIYLESPEKFDKEEIKRIDSLARASNVGVAVGYQKFFSEHLKEAYKADCELIHDVTNLVFEHEPHQKQESVNKGFLLRECAQDLAAWIEYWKIGPENIVDVCVHPENTKVEQQEKTRDFSQIAFTITTTRGRNFTLVVSRREKMENKITLRAGLAGKEKVFTQTGADSFKRDHLQLKRELIDHIRTGRSDMLSHLPGLDHASSVLELIDSLSPALLAQANVPEPEAHSQSRKIVFTTRDVVCKTPTQQRIWYAPDLFAADCRLLIDALRPPRKRIILCADDKVWSIYGDMIDAWAAAQEIELVTITVPNGEQAKAVGTWLQTMREFWDANPLRHTEPIVAIGGGAVTDLVGFAASAWRRSTPWVRIPTTLLGMIDASVGVKVSVNFMRKNGIGDFHSPRHTFIDPTFLRSNSERELKAAVGEVMKAGIIYNKRIYDLMRAEGPRLIKEQFLGANGLPCDTARQVINLCIQAMIDCIAPDLYEENLSREMDFGHTFSRWMERHERFCLMHGEAVAVDSVFSVLIAEKKRWLTKEETDDILQTYKNMGLFVHVHGLMLDVYQEAIKQTTVHRSGSLRAPLPCPLGQCRWTDNITQEELEGAWQRLGGFTENYQEGVLNPNQSLVTLHKVGYRATDGFVVHPLDELPASDKATRWGILGCGNIAHDFALVLKEVPNAVMAAAAARDANRAREFAQRHGIPKSYGNYNDLVEDPEIDIIYVATIPELHREHTELALRAGKHVLVEKPLATTPEDVAAIHEAAKASGKFCMEGMWMRFFPAVELARRAVREGKIGEIQHVRSDFGFDLVADEGLDDTKWECGAGMNAGVYPVHATVMVLGTEVSELSSIGSVDNLGYGMDAEGTVYVRFGKDKTSVITWSHLVETAEEVDIIGTKGCIRIQSPAHAPTTVTIKCKSGNRRDGQVISTTHEFSLPLVAGKFFYPNSEGLYYEATAVQRCLAAGLVQAPQAPLAESVRVIEMLHKAVQGIVEK